MNIRDVAQLANVSVATVSRVLSNKGDVAPETRQRIMQIMDEVGYIPSTIANRNNALGVLLSKEVKLLEEGYELQILRGISEVAFMAAKAVVLLPGDLKPMQPGELLHLRRTNGLGSLICIAPPERTTAGFVESVVESGIPHVMLPNRVDTLGANWMTTANRKAAADAVNYLLNLGHRRIAFINDINAQASDRQDRLTGYRQTLQQSGCPVETQYILDSYENRDVLRQCLRTWLQSAEPPTAILTASFRATLHTCADLRILGVSIPKDISVVGFGDSMAYEYQDPPLSVIRHPWVELGRQAAQYLLNAMDNATTSAAPICLELPATLVMRKSAQPLQATQPLQVG